MTDFKVPQAEFKGVKYTPEQWQHKNTLCSKSKKKTDANLLCPDGCTLTFRKGSEYVNKHGTQVIVRPHFAHVNKSKTDSCLYVKKYGSNGESKEHFETKESIAANGIVAHEICSYPSCSSVKEYRSHENWVAKTEVKLNNKWFMDVVFYDTNGDIALVVEVKHTHGTDGLKREWLLQQNFDYIEVDTNGPTYTVLDSKTDFWCMDNHMCLTEKKECKDEMERCFYRFLERVDITLPLDYLMGNWINVYRKYRFYNDNFVDTYEKYHGYDYTNVDDIEMFNKLLYNHEVQSGTSYYEYRHWKIVEKERREEKKRRQEEEEKKRKEEEERRKEEEERGEEEKEKLIRTREKEAISYHHAWGENSNEKEICKAWVNSNINKQLLEWEPLLKYPSGFLKGCHLLLVMFAYPHQIDWLMGFNARESLLLNYVRKHKHIYERVYKKTRGRRFKCISRRYDPELDEYYYELMKEWVNNNESYKALTFVKGNVIDIINREDEIKRNKRVKELKRQMGKINGIYHRYFYAWENVTYDEKCKRRQKEQNERKEEERRKEELDLIRNKLNKEDEAKIQKEPINRSRRRIQREYEFAKQKREADKLRKNRLKKQKTSHHKQISIDRSKGIHKFF